MATRLQDNQLKGIFFLILFTVLTVHSALTDTQPGALKTENSYEAGFYQLPTPVGDVHKFHAPVTKIRGHR